MNKYLTIGSEEIEVRQKKKKRKEKKRKHTQPLLLVFSWIGNFFQQAPITPVTTTEANIVSVTSSEKRLKGELNKEMVENEGVLFDDIISPVRARGGPVELTGGGGGGNSGNSGSSIGHITLPTELPMKRDLKSDAKVAKSGGEKTAAAQGDNDSVYMQEARNIHAVLRTAGANGQSSSSVASRLFATHGRRNVMMEEAVVVSGAGCEKINGV